MSEFWSGVLVVVAIVAILVGAIPLGLVWYYLRRKRQGNGW